MQENSHNDDNIECMNKNDMREPNLTSFISDFGKADDHDKDFKVFDIYSSMEMRKALHNELRHVSNESNADRFMEWFDEILADGVMQEGMNICHMLKMMRELIWHDAEHDPIHDWMIKLINDYNKLSLDSMIPMSIPESSDYDDDITAFKQIIREQASECMAILESMDDHDVMLLKYTAYDNMKSIARMQQLIPWLAVMRFKDDEAFIALPNNTHGLMYSRSLMDYGFDHNVFNVYSMPASPETWNNGVPDVSNARTTRMMPLTARMIASWNGTIDGRRYHAITDLNAVERMLIERLMDVNMTALEAYDYVHDENHDYDSIAFRMIHEIGMDDMYAYDVRLFHDELNADSLSETEFIMHVAMTIRFVLTETGVDENSYACIERILFMNAVMQDIRALTYLYDYLLNNDKAVRVITMFDQIDYDYVLSVSRYNDSIHDDEFIAHIRDSLHRSLPRKS